MNFFKTTILGGFIFLIPFVIVVVVVSKAFEIMLAIHAPLKAYIPTGSFRGIGIINLVVMLAILLLCFLAGLIVKSSWSNKMYHSLDASLLSIPGYTFFKGLTGSLSGPEETANNFLPVLARFDDYSQIGFEIERTDDNVVVYLPGAPNPLSGFIAYLNVKQVRRLEMSVSQALRNIRKIGRGSTGYSELEL
ncbi:DUF502 domain-containing protein [bacterium]|nr:DUF502 domain-containing protein [bacterium]